MSYRPFQSCIIGPESMGRTDRSHFMFNAMMQQQQQGDVHISMSGMQGSTLPHAMLCGRTDMPRSVVPNRIENISARSYERKDTDTRRAQRSRKRTKAGRYASDITYEELSKYFHLPTTKACKQIGCGLTMFKKICRQFGLERWPYRRRVVGNQGKSSGTTAPHQSSPEQTDHDSAGDPVSTGNPSLSNHHASADRLISADNPTKNEPTPVDATAVHWYLDRVTSRMLPERTEMQTHVPKSSHHKTAFDNMNTNGPSFGTGMSCARRSHDWSNHHLHLNPMAHPVPMHANEAPKDWQTMLSRMGILTREFHSSAWAPWKPSVQHPSEAFPHQSETNLQVAPDALAKRVVDAVRNLSIPSTPLSAQDGIRRSAFQATGAMKSPSRYDTLAMNGQGMNNHGLSSNTTRERAVELLLHALMQDKEACR